MGSKALGLIGVCLLAVASAEAGPLDVDPWSGALVLERTDLSLGEGDAAFELRRTLQAEGWAWSCDSRLGQAEDGALCWIDEAGRAHAFVKAGEGWVARYGAPWTLAQTQSGYALVAGGRTYRFDGAGPAPHVLMAMAIDDNTVPNVANRSVARALGREFSKAMNDAARESGVNDVAGDLKKYSSPKSFGLDKLNDEVEVPLIPVLASMELAGIRVDLAALKALSSELAERATQLL